MSDLICRVEQGDIIGRIEKDIDGNPFIGFLGIRYAKPPVGEQRFKAPQPPEKWSGISDGTREGSPCYSLQLQWKKATPRMRLQGSEDCLFLNVFTHQLYKGDRQILRPVMVFIHGGAFTTGSSSGVTYGPQYLMTEDIVLVLINYRLGALGFLSIDDPSLGATGNAGIKDQIMALKWIQNNIKQFCGDPSNVTVFGQNAGSVSIHYLVLSPLSKGLFHKAIMQSGTATCPWARGANDIDELAKYSGCRKKDTKEMFRCLQSIKVKRLVKAQNKSFGKVQGPGAKGVFGPTIEVKHLDALITEEPLKLINSGTYNHVPLMFGYTNLEGIINAQGRKYKVKKRLKDLLPYSFGYDSKSWRFQELNKKIIQFYFGKDKADAGNREIVAKLITDIAFLRGIFQSVKGHARTSQKPVYLYRMSLETELNVFKKLLRYKSRGVCHGDDIFYIFKAQYTKFQPHSIEEMSMRRFVKMWTNFAKNSNPIPSIGDPLLDTHWYPITGQFYYFMDIGEQLLPDINPDFDRIKFWEEISKGINERY